MPSSPPSRRPCRRATRSSSGDSAASVSVSATRAPAATRIRRRVVVPAKRSPTSSRQGAPELITQLGLLPDAVGRPLPQGSREHAVLSGGLPEAHRSSGRRFRLPPPTGGVALVRPFHPQLRRFCNATAWLLGESGPTCPPRVRGRPPGRWGGVQPRSSAACDRPRGDRRVASSTCACSPSADLGGCLLELERRRRRSRLILPAPLLSSSTSASPSPAAWSRPTRSRVVPGRQRREHCHRGSLLVMASPSGAEHRSLVSTPSSPRTSDTGCPRGLLRDDASSQGYGAPPRDGTAPTGPPPPHALLTRAGAVAVGCVKVMRPHVLTYLRATSGGGGQAPRRGKSSARGGVAPAEITEVFRELVRASASS